jgi:hypothetical protein
MPYLPSNPGLEALGFFEVIVQEFARVHDGAGHDSRVGYVVGNRLLIANSKTMLISFEIFPLAIPYRLLMFVEAPVSWLLFR